LSEAGPAIARFDFKTGLQRGSSLTLYANCLVHRSASHLETLPLASFASVRVAFERNVNWMVWGGVLVLFSLVLLALSGPLASFAGSAASEVSANATGVAAALATFFRILEAIGNALPWFAGLIALGGGALGGFGWLGGTFLSVTFAGGERIYEVHGRNTLLLDFAEAIAGRLMMLRR
jgi:hypothetical protein